MDRVSKLSEEKRVVYVTHMERLARQDGRQDAVLILLGKKFGPVPDEVVTRVRGITDPTAIDDLLGRALAASSLDELFPPS